jgi:hypothetical protein
MNPDHYPHRKFLLQDSGLSEAGWFVFIFPLQILTLDQAWVEPLSHADGRIVFPVRKKSKNLRLKVHEGLDIAQLSLQFRG